MCGVLGIAIKNFNEKDYDLVRSLFIQSMIRGKHATGVSFVKHNYVRTISESLPADEFIKMKNLKHWTNEDGNLYCIGHIRYSTSDLRFNQPMSTDELAIVHNGVISQEPKETWFEKYGYETKTSNDSELILRCLEKQEHPLDKFNQASMAVCTIDNNKVIRAFRNKDRPLYYNFSSRGIFFASTEDILERSGLTSNQKTSMLTDYEVSKFMIIANHGRLTNSDMKDLQ
jgi:glutamine phosphoribosylpyrophosphate amidotransferase